MSTELQLTPLPSVPATSQVTSKFVFPTKVPPPLGDWTKNGPALAVTLIVFKSSLNPPPPARLSRMEHLKFN